MLRLAARRLVAITLLWLALVPATALGHAVPVAQSPPAGGRIAVAPITLTIRFSETVTLLRDQDLQVLDASGALVTGGPARRTPTDAHQVEVSLRPGLPDGTYTVRWFVVSADSHPVGGVYVFAIGNGPIGDPYAGALTGGGPGDESVWAVSARALELMFLGGLVGMLAWRWLVWRPAAAGASEEALIWGRDLFWSGFGLLAAGSMLAEGYLLVTKSATLLGTSMLDTLKQPGEIARVLSETRFGTLAQVRASLLFGVFVIAIWQFLVEMGPNDGERVGLAGRRIPAALMTGLAVATFAAISAQGHASTGPVPGLAIAADLVHLVAASVWITGIAMVLVTLWRAPHVLDDTGRALAGATLTRYSRIALIAVSATVLAGVARSLSELSDPAQLWSSSYGRSIIYKLLLLCPVAALGLRHKRIATAVGRVDTPSAAALRMIRRSAALEFVLALAIVVIASVLVSQVPGRTG